MPYHRSPARFLAPLAILAALFAVFVTVRSTSDAGGDDPTVTQEPTRTAPREGGERRPTRYTVRSGDVLSTIAAEADVPLERLLELNPELDPQELRTGQRIKLRP